MLVEFLNNNSIILQVIDALELAFQELDSEDSCVNNNTMEDAKSEDPAETKTADIIDFTETKVAPLYENMDMFFQNSVGDVAAFPLDLPTNAMEPPKEKPPPPPTEDDELLGNVSRRPFSFSWFECLLRLFFVCSP